MSQGGRGGGTSLQEANGDVTLDGSHFHGWIDYHGVAFSIQLLKMGRTIAVFRSVVRFLYKKLRLRLLRFVDFPFFSIWSSVFLICVPVSLRSERQLTTIGRG